mgnify:FL=1
MADQAINALPVKTAPTTGDKMLMIGAAEEYQIDYDQLATAILNKLASKTFTLDQGTKSLVAALNELNSKSNTRILLNRTLTDANTTYEVNMSKYNRGMVFVLFNANKSIKQSSILYSFSRSSSLTSLVELVNKNLENSGYKIESVVLNQDTIAITTGIYGGSLAVIYIGA